MWCFLDGKPLHKEETEGLTNRYASKYASFAENHGAPGSTFQITMMQTPSHETKYWCCACFPIISFCAIAEARKKALEHVYGQEGLYHYSCGQGYFDTYGLSLKKGKQCALQMLYLEACCLPSCSVSGTRLLVMDRYQLEPDECDNRLIRLNNCAQMLEFIFVIVAFLLELRNEGEVVEVTDCMGDTAFCCISSCMVAQVRQEIDFREGRKAPMVVSMNRQ
mmetsp:Transcript_32724/g.75302  ORF Transcript_32724/g.75302 Transcript_32724/m.75302 type:complete len:221 (-) Transcript_32724:155-817(-)